MIENESQQAEEEIQIEIADEAEQPQQSDDELNEYSKRVSRRVNKLNARAREAEERAAAAERLAQEREQQLYQYRNIAASHETAALTAEEGQKSRPRATTRAISALSRVSPATASPTPAARADERSVSLA